MKFTSILDLQRQAKITSLQKSVEDGTYVDNPKNRKLGRVGQKYTKDEETKKEDKKSVLILQGIEFKKYGETPYPGRNGRGASGTKIGNYKAEGPTGNIVYTNDFNNDFSVRLPKEYSIYDISKNELKPAEYIRLKDDKVKDYFDGKISIEEAGTPFSWEYFVKNGTEEEKKLRSFASKKMESKHSLNSEEMKKIREFTNSRNLEGLIKIYGIKEKEK